ERIRVFAQQRAVRNEIDMAAVAPRRIVLARELVADDACEPLRELGTRHALVAVRLAPFLRNEHHVASRLADHEKHSGTLAGGFFSGVAVARAERDSVARECRASLSAAGVRVRTAC